MNRRKFISRSIVVGIAGAGAFSCATLKTSNTTKDTMDILSFEERKKMALLPITHQRVQTLNQ